MIRVVGVGPGADSNVESFECIPGPMFESKNDGRTDRRD